ncbi:MAG: SMC-Scp complex subunit ScpB [Myxococcales bacterium]|nr:SMC-Scp complex subunit ScpB [Myxococcales bacterium]
MARNKRARKQTGQAEAPEAVADVTTEVVETANDDEAPVGDATLMAAAEPTAGDDASERGELAADGQLDQEAGDLAADAPDDAPLDLAADDDETDASALSDDDCKRLITALVFASDRPLPLPRIRQLLRMRDMKRVTRLVAELVASTQDDGIVLGEASSGFQFRTNPRFSGWVQHIIAGRPVRLSRAQLETLAIVAYRQPITRPEIDDIRGVDSGATLKILLERNLIKMLGKREEAGRPILYGTTREFLDFFSLGDLRDLPTLREFTELSPENQALLERQQPLAGDDLDPGTPAVEVLAQLPDFDDVDEGEVAMN